MLFWSYDCFWWVRGCDSLFCLQARPVDYPKDFLSHQVPVSFHKHWTLILWRFTSRGWRPVRRTEPGSRVEEASERSCEALAPQARSEAETRAVLLGCCLTAHLCVTRRAGSVLTAGGRVDVVILSWGWGSSHTESRFFFLFWGKNHLRWHYAVLVIHNDYCIFSSCETAALFLSQKNKWYQKSPFLSSLFIITDVSAGQLRDVTVFIIMCQRREGVLTRILPWGQLLNHTIDDEMISW